MNLLMSFNSDFMVPGLIAIYSLFKSNNDVNLFIFYTELSENERIIIDKVSQQGINNKVTFVYIDNAQVPQNCGRFSIYTFYRFLAYKILTDIDRIIYIDADVIVKSDISELAEMSLEGNLFAGCLDPTSNPKERLGLEKYINAGVLVMDLNRIRRSRKMDAYWKLVFDGKYENSLPDQDALNIVFNNYIKILPSYEWNCFPFYETDEDFDIVINESKIVHYVSKRKPWLEEYTAYWEAISAISKISDCLFRLYLKNLDETVQFLEK